MILVLGPPLCVEVSRFKNSRRSGLSSLLEWSSRPCESPLTFGYLPLLLSLAPSPRPCRAAPHRRVRTAVAGVKSLGGEARSARDVVAAVVVVLVQAEQLALLRGEPPPAHLLLLLQLLHGRSRTPHPPLLPLLRLLPALRRRRKRLQVHHPRTPGRRPRPCAGSCYFPGAVPQRGRRARHRGHLPFRRQHLRHHPLPPAQVGI